MDITPEACRAARALLRWTTLDLANQSGVATTTINRLENGEPFREGTADKLIFAFRMAGVEVLGQPKPGARIEDSMRFAQGVRSKRA